MIDRIHSSKLRQLNYWEYPRFWKSGRGFALKNTTEDTFLCFINRFHQFAIEITDVIC